MKKILFAVAITALLSACNGSSTPKNTAFELKGTLTNAVGGETIYLEELSPSGKILLDSAVLDEKGNFSFTHSAPAIGFYRVKVNEANFAMLVLDSTQKIKLTGNFKDIGNTYTVEGSPDTKIFLDFNDLGKTIQIRSDSLQRAFQAAMGVIKMDSMKVDSLNKIFEPIYMSMMEGHQQRVADIVSKNTNSLAALAGIQQLDPDKYLDIYKKAYADLSVKFPNNKYLGKLQQDINSFGKVAGGSEAPDFTFNTPEGKPLSLSSFRGKILLVDFWASWCGPCRKENPNVLRMYKKYHSKGFEILGVSLDESKEKWVAAIKKDGLVWNHISDLKGWGSQACNLYGIEAIPFAMLLDKDGKIIAKNLRGASLEKKLEELFK
ncbi:MAG TPA: TlpA disulfide reductase family protein [Bacteroidia bacterium]|jgi:thiol-disulfide isomerase/thioredoxin|nr:TlpA disulfide reductase family protein [Bacteroidia bacterium]